VNNHIFLHFGVTSNAGVISEKIGKGRILADLRDICRICLELFPLQKSNEQIKNKENTIQSKETLICSYHLSIFFSLIRPLQCLRSEAEASTTTTLATCHSHSSVVPAQQVSEQC